MKIVRPLILLVLLGCLITRFQAQADVIWRATNYGFSKSFLENEMANRVNTPSGGGEGLTFFDIDLDGNSELGVRWSVFDGFSSPTYSCSGTPLTTKGKIVNIGILGGSSSSLYNHVVAGYLNTIIDPNTPVNSSVGVTTSEVVFAHLDKKFFTPYPTTQCSGSSSLPTTEGGLFNSGGYFGVKILRNGNLHMGWIRVLGGAVVEVAYESKPYMPIRIGDKNSVFPHVTSSYVCITGQVYRDANGDCIRQAGDVGLSDVEVQLKNTTYKAITTSTGNYTIYVPYQNGSIYELETRVNSKYGTLTSCSQLVLPAVTSAGQIINRDLYVEPSNCANVEVKINMLPLRRCAKNRVYINYQNTGKLTASGRQIKVAMPDWIKAVSSSPAWTSYVNDTVTYNLPSLTALAEGTIVLVDSVVCGEETIRGMDQCLTAFVTPALTCVGGNTWTGPEVNISGVCEAGVFAARLTNTGSSMTDSLSYRILINKLVVREAKYKLAAGEGLVTYIPLHGNTLYIEVDQSPLHPVLAKRTLALEGCGDFVTDVIEKGHVHMMPYVKAGNTEATACGTILDSYDPNDKTATPGEGKIEANTDIYYTIRFQNTGTLSAINVVVDDTLSEELDLSRLEIVSTSHPSVLSSYLFTINGKKLLKFTFYGINLATKQSNEAASQGYVTIKVSQKPDLAIGTQIKNKAHIYFDYNSAIITNEVVHEIGVPFEEAILKVTSGLESSTACAGENVHLAVQSENEESYRWYKDDVLLPGENLASLSITALDDQKEGVYRCEVIGLLDTLRTSASIGLKTEAECSVTSVEDGARSQAKTLYPNPAKHNFYIKVNREGSFTLSDMYGVTIEKGSLNEGINKIDPQQVLKQGYYLVTIVTENGSHSEPLIVQ